MIFQGMQDHTATSIKSLEGFGRAWVEEAQSITKKSLDMLIPTIRAPGSEIWYSWNPDQPTDPARDGGNVGRLISVEDHPDPVTGIPRMGALPVVLLKRNR